MARHVHRNEVGFRHEADRILRPRCGAARLVVIAGVKCEWFCQVLGRHPSDNRLLDAGGSADIPDAAFTGPRADGSWPSTSRRHMQLAELQVAEDAAERLALCEKSANGVWTHHPGRRETPGQRFLSTTDPVDRGSGISWPSVAFSGCSYCLELSGVVPSTLSWQRLDCSISFSGRMRPSHAGNDQLARPISFIVTGPMIMRTTVTSTKIAVSRRWSGFGSLVEAEGRVAVGNQKEGVRLHSE